MPLSKETIEKIRKLTGRKPVTSVEAMAQYTQLKDKIPANLAKYIEGIILKISRKEYEALKGQPGEPGEEGPEGDAGTPGVAGARGPRGIQGEKGEPGARGPSGNDGKNGERGFTGPKGEKGDKGEPGEKGAKGPAGSPDSPQDILQKLLSLGDGWLPFEAIKDLPTVTRELPNISIFGGGRSGGSSKMEIVADGVPLGQDIRKILLQGDVVGIRNADGVVTLVFAGGSGGSTLNFETPVGIIDGVNDTFTVSNAPLYIVLNGVQYFENDGYTLSGLVVTMLVVPETGSTLRSAYNTT